MGYNLLRDILVLVFFLGLKGLFSGAFVSVSYWEASSLGFFLVAMLPTAAPEGARKKKDRGAQGGLAARGLVSVLLPR